MQHKLDTLLSMMTFQDYFTKYINISNIHLAEGWGWFVDIDINYQNNTHEYNKYYIQQSNYNCILPIINENRIYNIRSFKSMKNLKDQSTHFEFDKIDRHKYVSYCVHSICILGLIGIFYSCHFYKFKFSVFS